ncbi:hypothetical protein NQ317_008496 [Molorchus minor]|uniref:Uncharacterized protein n=1 Tax=Molorchus minor TaxID=1323400 RepID=A0ABQ9JLW6_9CUCU|nr:hypothetical protein NQ317_008496 [Molorchus minor]
MDNSKEPKPVCKSYEEHPTLVEVVARSEDLGRYLKATRDIERSDVIFSDYPLIFGPKHHRIEDGQFLCIGCCRPDHMLQTEEEVLDIVEDDPSTSTREIARQMNRFST